MARTPSPRPARSICSCLKMTWPAPASKVPKFVSTSPLRPRRNTRLSRGVACGQTTCRSSPPTTARSASWNKIRPWRLHQDPERPSWSREPHGSHLPGCRLGRDQSSSLGGGHLDQPRQDVRSLSPQGAVAPRVRRRHRHLRPNRRADDLGRNPPHGGRLLVL